MFQQYTEIIEEAENKIKESHKKYEEDKIKNISEIKDIQISEIQKINGILMEDYSPVELQDKIIKKTEEFKTIIIKKTEDENKIKEEMDNKLSEKISTVKSKVIYKYFGTTNSCVFARVGFCRYKFKKDLHNCWLSGEVISFQTLKCKYEGEPLLKDIEELHKEQHTGDTNNFAVVKTCSHDNKNSGEILALQLYANLPVFGVNFVKFEENETQKVLWGKWLAFNTPYSELEDFKINELPFK